MGLNKNLDILNKLYDEGNKVLATNHNDSSFDDSIIILEDEVDISKFTTWRLKCISHIKRLSKSDDTYLKEFEEC